MSLVIENYVSIASLQSLIVGENVVEDDMSRWFSQDMTFSQPNFGLKQGHGGPCGILAALQAELIKDLVFIGNSSQVGDELPHFPESLRNLSFSKAIWNILWRCRSHDSVYLVHSTHPLTHFHECVTLPVTEFTSQDTFVSSFSQQYLSCYSNNSGCFLFLLSLVLTRGISTIKCDMDDPTASCTSFSSIIYLLPPRLPFPLLVLVIGQFGHCTQELINLLLLGEAVSNVFDGDVPMDPTSTDPNSLKLKGAHHQSEIGYLTQLESLRYCQVGSYLKIPIYPIWVIGSQSHFTVLFSLREINEQSQEEKLFSRVQREFKSLDPQECGFLLEDKLPLLLTRLSVPFASDPADVRRFSASIQIDGGIILWSTFWENISKILTGTSLDSLLLGTSQAVVISPPATTTTTAAGSSSSSSGSIPQPHRRRSDSEIARELQANFDRNPFYDEQQFPFPAPGPAAVSASSTGHAQQGRARSDSEIARQMEEEWNRAEDSNPPPYTAEESVEVLPPAGTKRHRSDSIATKDDENFICYHYNGLDIRSSRSTADTDTGFGRGRQNLTKFRLYRRSKDTAIGQSIGLSTGGGVFADTGQGNQLEEVLRTRWTGCRVDYLGNPSPTID